MLGDMQHFIVREIDEGPFWMSPAQQLEKKCDKSKGTFKQRGELIAKLLEKAVVLLKCFLPKSEIQELYHSHGIEMEIYFFMDG